MRSSHRHISGITPQPFPDMPPTQHPASSSRPLCDRHRGRKCIASTPSLSPAPHSLTTFPRLPSGSARSLRQRTSGRLRCSGSTQETLTGPDSVRPREESGTLILIRDCSRQSRPQTLIRKPDVHLLSHKYFDTFEKKQSQRCCLCKKILTFALLS